MEHEVGPNGSRQLATEIPMHRLEQNFSPHAMKSTTPCTGASYAAYAQVHDKAAAC